MARWTKIVVALACICLAIIAIRLTANSDLRFTVLTCAVLAGGVATYCLYKLDGLSISAILVIAIGLRLILISTPPAYSEDAFRYLWDGSLVANQLNPFLFTPEETVNDPVVRNFRFESLNSAPYYSVYPPVSQYVFGASVWIGKGDWRRSYLALKTLIVLFELCGLFLIASLASRKAMLLYALNPIVIFEVAGQAHTEAIAVPFLIAAIAATKFRRPVLAGVALGTATLVKLYPIVLLPALIRRAGWPVLLGFAATIAVLAMPFAQFDVIGNVVSSLVLYVKLFEFNAGPYLLLKGMLQSGTGIDFSKQLGPILASVGIAAIVALHMRDSVSRNLETLAVAIFGILIVTATTVHPWYFLPMLAIIAIAATRRWHWQWLSIVSAGTYLLYAGGPYWLFVWIGWFGAVTLFAWTIRFEILEAILKRRARRKAQRIRSLLALAFGNSKPGESVIDIGAGEGYVGEELIQEGKFTVQLTDIRDCNHTALPFVQADASNLPFADSTFDYSMLFFVLHHSEGPERILVEADRVSRRGIVIVESTYRSNKGLRALIYLDRLANRIRSQGTMRAQEDYLVFRTVTAWKKLFVELGLVVQAEQQWGSLLHRQVGFVVSSAPKGIA